MSTFLKILALLGALEPQIVALVQQALAANTANDQATLDALHAQATVMANSLRPTGA